MRMRAIRSMIHLSLPISILSPVKSSSRRRCATLSFIPDRIDSNGSLTISSSVTNQPPNYVIGTPIHGKTAAPEVGPPNPADIDRLAEFLDRSGGNVLIVTGAGCSTESNIPDYRSPGGAYSTGFKPMTHQAFMATEQNRQRYWQRSYVGWERFSKVSPNAAHFSIATLQHHGYIGSLITQNVDRLHHKAGSPPHSILELHGTTHEVVCVGCRAILPREDMQLLLSRLNPEARYSSTPRTLRPGKELPKEAQERLQAMRPDGDIELDSESSTTTLFQVPPCPVCGGILKPNVVFFGDNLPKERSKRSLEMTDASAVLVVGSSLAVYSAFRLIKHAREERNIPLAILTIGQTRADGMEDIKVEARAGDVLQGIVNRLIDP